MSDPTVGGTMVPVGDGGGAWAWPSGRPRFGDMVWAKVKSHPWWPGHIYSITLTDNAEVHRGHRDGLILVAFFGDSSYGWFEPHEIVPFEEHFAEKAAQGVSTRSSFSTAVAEAVDEVARRAALGMLCPCRNPDACRPHPFDARYLLVDVPGFDSGADYHPDQIAAARERFLPRKALGFLLDAAVAQQDAAEAAARSLPAIEMAGLFGAYRRATFLPHDDTYAEAFGVDPDKIRAAEEKAAAERAQRARPLSGKRKTPTEEAAHGPGRRRGGGAGAAARLMEKIVPSAAAMKVKSAKKDQYLLKRRDPPPEPAHRPPPLPDAPPPAQDIDGPPGYGADPPTPPLPGSTVEEEEFMLQRRAPPVEIPPPVIQATEGVATMDAAAPKKVTKPKKARKREREEEAAAAGAGAPSDAAAAELKKKKKKKFSAIEGGAGPNAPSAAGSGRASPPKVVGDLNGIDLKQVVSDLPLASFNGAERRISDTARSFILAFRSKHYKKSYENDPREEYSKESLDRPGAAAEGLPVKKKKPMVRPGAGGDPTKAGVKRAPSDRQEEMAVKKKAKLDKIKALPNEKKAAGLEPQKLGGARPAMKDKPDAVARKKEPAPAPRVKAPSPTALMMKFPLKSTLPSVASLKARFARFGPLDIDGIRVYWKSNMCRVIYKFRSDAEAALKYARANAMFGQVDAQYHIKEVEVSGGEPAAAADAPPPRSDLRLMETTSFRPGASSGNNSSPLPLSRAVAPPRVTAAVGQQPKSILKKSTDDGGPAMREGSRVKFMLETGDTKVEPPAPPATGNGGARAKTVGFAALQPPMRPAQQPPLQPPRTAATLPPPPYPARTGEGGQLPPYPPRHTDAPLAAFSTPPSQQQPLPYPPRHNDGMPLLPGQPPYQPRPAGQQQQQLPPRPGAAEDVPAWKRSEKEFKDEVWRVMTGIAKMVEPLTDKNGFFPYHLFRAT